MGTKSLELCDVNVIWSLACARLLFNYYCFFFFLSSFLFHSPLRLYDTFDRGLILNAQFSRPFLLSHLYFSQIGCLVCVNQVVSVEYNDNNNKLERMALLYARSGCSYLQTVSSQTDQTYKHVGKSNKEQSGLTRAGDFLQNHRSFPSGPSPLPSFLSSSSRLLVLFLSLFFFLFFFFLSPSLLSSSPIVSPLPQRGTRTCPPTLLLFFFLFGEIASLTLIWTHPFLLPLLGFARAFVPSFSVCSAKSTILPTTYYAASLTIYFLSSNPSLHPL